MPAKELAFSQTASDPDGDAVSTAWYVDGEQVASGETFTLGPPLTTPGPHAVVARSSDGRPDGGETRHAWMIGVVRPDNDSDGWRANLDCDEANAFVHPEADEVAGNGLDDDCDPATPDGPVVDPRVAIRPLDVTAQEGDTGEHDAAFELSLAAASPHSVAVNFRTADGTALAGADYLAATGRAVFDPGATRTTVSIPVLGDGSDEPDETFALRLSNPTQAVLAGEEATRRSSTTTSRRPIRIRPRRRWRSATSS